MNNEQEKTQPKKRLGISKDVQATAGIPIGAPIRLDKRTDMFPNSWEFPIANLVKVHFDPAKLVKREEIETPTPILTFIFSTIDRKQHTHTEFPIEDDDAKFDDKLGAMHQRIKHFFVETIGEDKFTEDSMDGEDFAEFFGNVAKAFNKETVVIPGKTEAENKTVPAYTRTPLYVKLTYYKTRVQFGLYPNLVQRAYIAGKQTKCELLINPQHDKVVPQERAAASTTYTGGTNAGYASAGNDGYPDIPDLP